MLVWRYRQECPVFYLFCCLSYPLFADGFSLGHPMLLVQSLLLDLCWGQLGLVILEVQLKLHPGSERGLLKWLEERNQQIQTTVFVFYSQYDIDYFPFVATGSVYNIVLIKRGKYLFLFRAHHSPLLGNLPNDVHWFNFSTQKLEGDH